MTDTGRFGDSALRIPTVSSNPVMSVPHTSEVVGAVGRALELAGMGRDDIDFIDSEEKIIPQSLVKNENFNTEHSIYNGR